MLNLMQGFRTLLLHASHSFLCMKTQQEKKTQFFDGCDSTKHALSSEMHKASWEVFEALKSSPGPSVPTFTSFPLPVSRF